MRGRIARALVASVAAGMLVGGAAVASTGSAVAVPAKASVADSQHAATPHPTPTHKKCPNGEHYTKVNGKWGCHKK
ncbi:hypothetical protein ACFY1J_42940 [Streptomyces sp. NPDC001406]|uniref:hypothetical protein n=1 Tax=Streptomyces sp. NPDC001406 TaxID=3364572 RepID=UPI0036CF560A